MGFIYKAGGVSHLRPSKDRGGDSLSKSYLALASGEGDVDETAGVCESLLRAALGGLLLLLGLNLGAVAVVSDHDSSFHHHHHHQK